MKTYLLRKNFTSIYLGTNTKTRAKIAFKAKEASWEGTLAPVVALVSVNSAFHVEVAGDLKMDAFMSTIKSSVRGKISILLADTAHFRVESLQNPEKTVEDCYRLGGSWPFATAPILKDVIFCIGTPLFGGMKNISFH